ncbi:binding-protein-dependent transport permease [Bordetella pertussis]|nr:binding-protein-dependent transport permease [Bordetella pertussis]
MANPPSNGRTRTVHPLSETPRRAQILKKLHSRPTVRGSVIALLALVALILLAPYFCSAPFCTGCASACWWA